MSDEPNRLTLSGPITDEGPRGEGEVSASPAEIAGGGDSVNQTLGEEARIVLKSVRVPGEGPLAEELQKEIVEVVQAHIRGHGLTYREVASQIGVAYSTVSEVLRGKYGGKDTSPILRKLNAWIDSDEIRRRRIKPLGFVDTGVVQGVRALAQFAKSNARVGERQREIVVADPQRIVIGWGPGGCGKSLAAKALHAEDPNSILIAVQQKAGTDSGLAREIIRVEGWRVRGKQRGALEVVKDKLRESGRLLIVDEAHRLSFTGCEFIRDLVDACGIPVLLLATEEFYQRLTAVRTRAGTMIYDQFARRVGLQIDLLRGVDGKGGVKRPVYSIEEVRAIFAADKLKITHDGIEMLCAAACTPGLGMLGLASNMFVLAQRSAIRGNRVIDENLLRQCARRVLIPAGVLDLEVMRQLDVTLAAVRNFEKRADSRLSVAG